MTYILLANGFEDIEALAPLDLLRRAGTEVHTVGMNGKTAVSSHGVEMVCDILPEQMKLDAIDMVILPGGAPGYIHLDEHEMLDDILQAALTSGYVGAICAAPCVVAKRGLLQGRTATCYPTMKEQLVGAQYSEQPVCVDGPFITSRSAGTAIEFALTLVAILHSKEKAQQIAREIYFDFSKREDNPYVTC